MKILVTGTPGVGKTTLAKQLSEKTEIEHIEITNFIKANELYDSYDKHFDTLVFDEDRVSRQFQKFVKNKESYIVDTHTPDVCARCKFDYILHVICNTKILYDRLVERGYSKKKINENIECEIFNVIGDDLDMLYKIKPIKVNGSEEPMDDVRFNSDSVVLFIKQKLRNIENNK